MSVNGAMLSTSESNVGEDRFIEKYAFLFENGNVVSDPVDAERLNWCTVNVDFTRCR